MAKAEIHAKLVDENGKLGVEVEANGYGLDLLDMTACGGRHRGRCGR